MRPTVSRVMFYFIMIRNCEVQYLGPKVIEGPISRLPKNRMHLLISAGFQCLKTWTHEYRVSRLFNGLLQQLMNESLEISFRHNYWPLTHVTFFYPVVWCAFDSDR